MSSPLDPIETEMSAALRVLPDSDAWWEAVDVLRRRNDRATFQALAEVVKSHAPLAQRFACDVLAQLGYPELERIGSHPFRNETVPILLSMLSSDDVGLLRSALVALGHQKPDDPAPILAHRDHPAPDVRYGVAFALGGRSEPEALDALLALMKDQNERVRDWATFAVGALSNTNTPELGAALSTALQDASKAVRHEASEALRERATRT